MDDLFDTSFQHGTEYDGINADAIWIGDQIAQTFGSFTIISPFGEIPVATNTFAVDKIQKSDEDGMLINIEVIEAEGQFAMALGSGVATNSVNIAVIQK